jgi:hypothetical protein
MAIYWDRGQGDAPLLAAKQIQKKPQSVQLRRFFKLRVFTSE